MLLSIILNLASVVELALLLSSSKDCKCSFNHCNSLRISTKAAVSERGLGGWSLEGGPGDDCDMSATLELTREFCAGGGGVWMT